MVVNLPALPEKPEPTVAAEDDWFLTTEELHRAMASDNGNNFDVRLTHRLVAMLREKKKKNF